MPRISTEVCELDNGRRVRFSLKKRPNSPNYFVTFRDLDNCRKELTTAERNKRRAQEVAITIIKAECIRTADNHHLPWDDAAALMLRHMKAGNLRSGSIQQYDLAVSALRKVFPDSHGPSDITPAMAEQFKVERIEAGLAARTVTGNVKNLSIIYGHWLRDTLRIIDIDPFDDVVPPKEDKQRPRVIEPEEKEDFFGWLETHWGWRLPLLFLEVKAAIGCRIAELASLRTEHLRDGRVRFISETTKGRKERSCLLPPALHDELRAVAGPTYVFERFAEQLRSIHKGRGNLHHARAVKDFSTDRLVSWLQKQAKMYFRETGTERFKLHNFRGTAMSRARMAGVSEDDAAVAFGCSTQTMREAYLSLDEVTIADGVFGRIN